MVISEYEDKRKQMLDQDYCQASTAACECGAKKRTSSACNNILPHLLPSKWSLCSLRYQKDLMTWVTEYVQQFSGQSSSNLSQVFQRPAE